MSTQSDERVCDTGTLESSRPEVVAARLQAFLQGELMLAGLCGLTRTQLYSLAEQGRHLYEEGQLSEARRVFEGLTVLEPSESYFHTGLGIIYQQQGELDMARREYDQSITLEEADVSTRCSRAEVLLQMGQLEAASEDLKRIAELDPEGQYGYSQRARGMALVLGALAHQLG